MNRLVDRLALAVRSWGPALGALVLALGSSGTALAAVTNPCTGDGTGIGAAFTNLMVALQHFGAPIAGAVVAYGGLKHLFGHTPQARMEANHVLYAAGIGLAITLLAPSIGTTLVGIVGGGCS
jgi:hypothetical protein